MKPSNQIDLANLEPFAQGSERLIYKSPSNNRQLVKVIKEKHRKRPMDNLYERMTLGPYILFMREYAAYISALMMQEKLGRRPPLPRIFGTVPTDQGIGQLVRMISDEMGKIAPTLQDLLQTDGFTQTELNLLNQFVEDLYGFHIVAYDLKPKNIVLEVKKSVRRFVLVDGFGDRALIPLKSIFTKLNNRKLDKEIAKLANQTGLVLDRKNRKFHFPEKQ
nr:YrbL family protein [Pseudaestuariivita rosea]